MPPANEPISTLKATLAYLAKPVRVDARRNMVTFDAKGLTTLRARIETQIARLQNHGGQP